jgi:hypothetical protein
MEQGGSFARPFDRVEVASTYTAYREDRFGLAI